MLKLIFLVLLFFDGSLNLSKIAKENALKNQAEVAFKESRFAEAIVPLKILVEQTENPEDEVVMNLAHAYFNTKDFSNAAKMYEKALNSANKKVKSVASQQLGILSMQVDNDKDKALAFFKESLRANPNNEQSRHNYELLKKASDKNEDKKDQNKKDKKDEDKKEEEPSEYAKQLKAKAEQLVAMHQYMEAYNLMNEGLKKDKTVNAFQDFIKRTKTIADINNL